MELYGSHGIQEAICEKWLPIRVETVPVAIPFSRHCIVVADVTRATRRIMASCAVPFVMAPHTAKAGIGIGPGLCTMKRMAFMERGTAQDK